MIGYMKGHEKYIRGQLAKDLKGNEWVALLNDHDKQIQWMQHERLVHLIVMLFVCLFFLQSLAYTMSRVSLGSMALAGILLMLSVCYIIHYCRLENTVQRWYKLSGQITGRIGEVRDLQPQ